ncbi:MAG: hypothetical protein EVA59_00030 [Limnobacter sp.]|uniref:tyrosine-type recombinase/integrase n=1 Tax=Limnobacter sp. TaxID=2003368 RepID=UPI001213F546|nr:tyrosine-type recombinase/integrase [Limnobacter sp.]RZO94188.1 MAG: hypothetical protein EVA59_00030 [Limnobacter sp.]
MSEKFAHLENLQGIQVTEKPSRVFIRVRIPKAYRTYFGDQYEVTPHLHYLMSETEALSWYDTIKSALKQRLQFIEQSIEQGQPITPERFTCPELAELDKRVEALKLEEKSGANSSAPQKPRELAEIDVKRAEKQLLDSFKTDFKEKLNERNLNSPAEVMTFVEELQSQEKLANLARLCANTASIQGRIEAYLAQNNLIAPTDSPLFHALSRVGLNKQVEALQFAQEYLTGRNIDAMQQVEMPSSSATVQTAFDVWSGAVQATEKSKNEAKKSVELFGAFCLEQYRTSLFLSEITTTVVADFKEWLKTGETDGQHRDAQRSSATVKKHFGLLNAVLNQYLDALGLSKADFVQFSWKRTRNESKLISIQTELRQMTKTEVQTIYAEETFEQLRVSDLPVNQVLPDTLELLLVTGMRLGELTRLTGAEVRIHQDNIVFSALNIPANLDSSGYERRTKTGKNREIFVKCSLISNGLFHRLVSLAGKHEEFVLPNLTFSKDGQRGKKLSQAFNRLTQALGINREGVCLHALRHLHIKYARACGVNENAVNSQVGHNDRHMYGYGGDMSIDEIAKAYSDFHFNFEHLPTLNPYVALAA